MPFPDDLRWNDAGLIPAIVQHAETGDVLMMAWMNAEALDRTRDTGFAHFYSRSRSAMWKKGETSGNTMAVRELRADCDADTILIRAMPAGPACHTNARSCFFHPDGAPDDDGPPEPMYKRLEDVLIARRDDSSAEKSYTKSLLEKGFPKILAKIAEEQGELAEVLPDGDTHDVVHETADLIFHVMVGLVARGISIAEVWRELDRRFGTSGHDEKASR